VGEGTLCSRDTYDIAADPSDFQHIVLSFHSPWQGDVGPGVLESTDGGKSFTPHTIVNGGAGHSIHFLHEPKLGIGDASTWLLGTQGKGFWRTTNAGISWTKVSDAQITHGGNFVCYSSKGVLYSGGYTYISRSTEVLGNVRREATDLVRRPGRLAHPRALGAQASMSSLVYRPRHVPSLLSAVSRHRRHRRLRPLPHALDCGSAQGAGRLAGEEPV
jgi:hypothetical protein